MQHREAWLAPAMGGMVDAERDTVLVKKLSLEAWEALGEVLATRWWYKKSFEKGVRRLFQDHPELVANIAFQALTKREVVDSIIIRAQGQERLCHDTLIQVMIELADTRPDSLTDYRRDDQAEKKKAALNAIEHLKQIVAPFREEVAQRERLEREMLVRAEAKQRRESFAAEHQRLLTTFSALEKDPDRQKAGKGLERLIADLADLYDLNPTSDYSLENEQIDGAFTFDHDGYIVEAKWLSKPVGRGEGDIFTTKVQRKGRNTLGLFVAVNGFTADFKQAYRERSCFITMDGSDLYNVLSQQVPFDDLLRAKKRHLDETGSCFMD